MPSTAIHAHFDPAVKVRLQKIMGLMGSANDHEALSALRRVQSMLGEHGMRFEDLVATLPVRAAAPAERPALKNHMLVIVAIMGSPRFKTLSVQERKAIRALSHVDRVTSQQSDILLGLASRVGIEVSYA